MARKHYAEFFYPGIFFAESTIAPVKDRKAKVKQPKGAYAYRFFSREEIKQGGKILRGDPKDYSGFRFFEGEILTLKEAKERYPKEDILIRNMENNKYPRVVHCKAGNWVPLNKKDRVLKEIII